MVREVFSYLSSELDEDVTQVNLVISGNKSVLVRSGEEIVDLLQNGQGVLNILPLAGVKEEVDAKIVDLNVFARRGVDGRGSPLAVNE